MVNFAFLHRHDHRKPPRTKSGYKGVIHEPIGYRGKPLSKPYKAYIRVHGVYRNIGRFKTAEEAAAAYNKEALRIKGEDTYLNPLPA